MHLLAFDGRMGASGDMILGALIDAGADPTALEVVTDALAVDYRIDRTVTCGIDATTVDVVLTDERDHAAGSSASAQAETSHDHRDDHGDHRHAEGHGPHRSYREVVEIVESMELPAAVEREALAIFELLGDAEASVHGEPLEAIHFHEVGADDAIADIVGAVALLADLEPDRVVTTPLATGGGTVDMSHGEYPVPTPAVVELAAGADWSLRGGPVERELLTPTAGAILAQVADGVETLPTIDLDAVGYGAGGYDLEPQPNVLRVVAGTTTGGLAREDIAVLETNLDDTTPEVLGGLQERLASAGARDVSIVPTTMKKSRPGHLVKVICRPADRERVARQLAEETGTLGVRDAGVTHRWIADRSIETVTLEIDGTEHEVRVKVARDDNGSVYDVSAEYDDVAAVATAVDEPVRKIATAAERRLEERSDRDGAER